MRREQTKGVVARTEERVLFEEGTDGLWWIADRHLATFKRLVGLRCEGRRVGFEPTAVRAYATSLSRQGVGIEVLKDNGFISLGPARRNKPAPVEYSILFLAPELLMDSAERERLDASTSLSKARLRELIAADLGSVYIYKVYENVYEIDWELTTIPRASLQAFLYAAYKLGKKMRCRLVAPKPQRGRRNNYENIKQHQERQPSQDTGQLRLDL